MTTVFVRRSVPTSRRRQHACRLALHALQWNVIESAKADLDEATAELASAASAAVEVGPAIDFGLLVVPARWAGDLAATSQKLRKSMSWPTDVPLVGVQSGGDAGDSEGSLRLGLARGGGKAISFFVSKEQQSEAGAGLAKENPVPGVPDGKHGSFVLFADPKVPGSLTKNLLEALDSRYPSATKAGMMVLPVKSIGRDDASEEDEWEPPKEARKLRVRDRSDGHGWLRGDPVFTSTSESLASADTLEAEFKRRPFGVKRYTPGIGGKGAMVMDMQDKERYKGDAMGQAATRGVRLGMVLKAVNGRDVRDWAFEDLMDLVSDQGIMDPDSKSAASWGKGGKETREPVPQAELPVSLEYMLFASDGVGAGKAGLCLNDMPKKEGTVGIAFPAVSFSTLDFACTPFGPQLEVMQSGKNPDGGFVVHSVKVNGKEMPAAAALKGYAKAAGLQSMTGISVGVVRPQVTEATSIASKWAVFPMMGVTKEGGLVLRCKGLAAEGLGADADLKSLQFFKPCVEEGAAAGCRGGSGLAFATTAHALRGVPAGTLGVVAAAVIGAAGDAEPTVLHRQAATFLSFSD